MLDQEEGHQDDCTGARTRIACSLALSLCLHGLILAAAFYLWSSKSTRATREAEQLPSFELRLQAPEVAELLTEEEQSAIETEPPRVLDAEEQDAVLEESDADTQGETREAKDEAGEEVRIDFDSLVRDTVDHLSGEADPELFENQPGIGDSAFDPRIREQLRRSKDINTAPPARPGQVTSEQRIGGSWYVEVQGGGCFWVTDSPEIGGGKQWAMTRCSGRSSDLELDPKPYSQIDP